MKETREHILKTSCGLFLKKSYKEVTLQEIVEVTGMSKGAFYHHFKNKEQIFLEIVEDIYRTVVDLDYGRLRSTSLQDFYGDYLAVLERTYKSLFSRGVFTSFDLNVYSLIFDAMRFFPDFREKMGASSARELKAWKAAVKAARERGEISSPMSDSQIAEIFIHTSSGVGMGNMMAGRNEETVKSLRALWSGFYAALSG